MRTLYLTLFIALLSSLYGQIPKPDHIVIAVFENRAYSYILANPAKAPYIHTLLADSNVAQFTQSYAVTHPSQPNYMILYSGSDQGLNTDTIPDDLPFNTCNLGSQLVAKGKTISSFCESMPSVGYLGKYSGHYVKRHNPVAYWQGTGTNNTPASISQPFTNFPTDFSKLPDVSFVIPNQANNMHDGGTKTGDDWLQANLKNYIDWTKTHNSLFILTFDEDDNGSTNHILTLFYGPMIKGGTYNSKIDHYNMLRTLEDIYGLNHCGNAGSGSPIDYVWKGGPTDIKNINGMVEDLQVYPIPAFEKLNIALHVSQVQEDALFSLVDNLAKRVIEKNVSLQNGLNNLELDTDQLSSGVYHLLIRSDSIQLGKKVLIK